MFGEGKSLLAASVAALLIAATANAAPEVEPSFVQASLLAENPISLGDIEDMRAAASGALLAVGQLETVSIDDSRIRVLDQDLQVLAGSQALEALRALTPGQMVAAYGEATPYGNFIWSIDQVGHYVPGASPVYLSGEISKIDPSSGVVWVGELAVSYVDPSSNVGFEVPALGDLLDVIGIQPLAGGVVLARSMGSPGASVGTGKSSRNASVGTGRSSAGASVGTGRSSFGASVGTGKSSRDASVGTGRSND